MINHCWRSIQIETGIEPIFAAPRDLRFRFRQGIISGTSKNAILSANLGKKGGCKRGRSGIFDREQEMSSLTASGAQITGRALAESYPMTRDTQLAHTSQRWERKQPGKSHYAYTANGCSEKKSIEWIVLALPRSSVVVSPRLIPLSNANPFAYVPLLLLKGISTH